MKTDVGWPSMQSDNTAIGGRGASTRPQNAPEVNDPPPSLQKASMRMRLETVADVRRELKRCYVDARNGDITSQDATRLGYLLDLLSRMIERSNLESRIEALEAARALQ
jgi:hypothetical protein